MRRTLRFARIAFDEGIYVAGLGATAFGGALLTEGVLVIVLGR